MRSVKQWKAACEQSQQRVNEQRDREEGLGWKVGLACLVALEAFFVVLALIGAVKAPF